MRPLPSSNIATSIFEHFLAILSQFSPSSLFLGSGPAEDDHLSYHHRLGNTGSKALSASSEALPAGFEALPAGSEALSAGSEALPAGSEAHQLAQRRTQLLRGKKTPQGQ